LKYPGISDSNNNLLRNIKIKIYAVPRLRRHNDVQESRGGHFGSGKIISDKMNKS